MERKVDVLIFNNIHSLEQTQIQMIHIQAIPTLSPFSNTCANCFFEKSIHNNNMNYLVYDVMYQLYPYRYMQKKTHIILNTFTCTIDIIV